MASTAVAAILTAMLVVSTVTGDALAGLVAGGPSIRLMARAANQPFMASRQSECRLPVMIKQPMRPFGGAMAQPAVGAERAAMLVLIRMARPARRGRVGKDLALMTRRAFHVFMPPQQRKAGQVMIKPRIFDPRCYIMARCAVFSLPALMGIVRPVAIDAAFARQGYGHRFQMA